MVDRLKRITGSGTLKEMEFKRSAGENLSNRILSGRGETFAFF
jgi:hypothetical protein